MRRQSYQRTVSIVEMYRRVMKGEEWDNIPKKETVNKGRVYPYSSTRQTGARHVRNRNADR